METLNLPSYDHKVKQVNGKSLIFDIIRKKFITLTPEEWVRQHFINLLIIHYGYPKSLFCSGNRNEIQFSREAHRHYHIISRGHSIFVG